MKESRDYSDEMFMSDYGLRDYCEMECLDELNLGVSVSV